MVDEIFSDMYKALSNFEEQKGRIIYSYAVDLTNSPSDEPNMEYNPVKGYIRKQGQSLKSMSNMAFYCVNKLIKEVEHLGYPVVKRASIIFITKGGHALKYDVLQ